MKFFIFVVFTSCLLSSCGEQTLEIQSDEIASDAPVTVENKFTEAAVIAGDYFCTISESTGIASSHLENSGPPVAFSDSSALWRFRLRVTREGDSGSRYKMVELPYTETDRHPVEWHTENSVLHGPYFGDGIEYSALEDQGFVSFHKTIHKNEDGDMSFYHAGFAWAGGEDSFLLARWGRCKLD